MGKSKTSRKGKKAWRTNISTQDIQDFYEQSSKDALSGGSLTEVPSDSLFFLDKSRGDHAVKKRKDALAHAVADEMQKVYTKELRPAPVPLTVDGEVVNEEDMYFLDADNESDDDAEAKDADENDDADLEKRPFKTKRITRVQLNKRARNKAKLKMEAEVKKVKEFSKDLDSLPDIIDEIAREDEEKKNRHLRCVTAKQERLKSCPPRLGRHKFEPAPVQVLLSEEITGSLRKLKACCTLARDRYKSLEKRGILVPTAKSGRK
ncbi:hypothetical protein M8C21_023621 [Ambrosia artemisiifolia]|uniref:Ribosome biogenesis protein NOP53 n=1 Tax=Ambrosia artemisiifolia TaxID=4212 RepID=A0AAD5CZ74_AMBAR|nr:hypothetical protein M8C21_023621 [Ambrosia artemisiifolia]